MGEFHNPWARRRNCGNHATGCDRLHTTQLGGKSGHDNMLSWLMQEPKNNVWDSGIHKERLCRLGLPRAARPVHALGRPHDHEGHGSEQHGCALMADSSSLDPYRPRCPTAGSVGSRASGRSRRSQDGNLQRSSSAPGGAARDGGTGASTVPALTLLLPVTGSHKGFDTLSTAPSSHLCPACKCKRCGRRCSSRDGMENQRHISTAPAPLGSMGFDLGPTTPPGTKPVEQVGETKKPFSKTPPSLLPELKALLSVG